MLPKLEDMDKELVEDHVLRAESRLLSYEKKMNQIALDWAVWDDSYNFIKNQNKEFVKANLTNDTYLNFDLDMILYMNAKGKMIYEGQLDRNQGDVEAIEQVTLDQLSEIGLNILEKDNGVHTGIISTVKGPCFVSIHKVTDTENKLDPNGLFMIARYMDDGLVTEIAKDTYLDFAIEYIGVNQEMRIIGDQAWKDDIFYEWSDKVGTEVEQVNNSTFVGKKTMDDMDGKPIVLVLVKTDMNLLQIGRDMMTRVALYLLLLGTIFTVILFFYFEKNVLKKLREFQSKLIQSEEQTNKLKETLEQSVHERTQELYDKNIELNISEIGLNLL
jgi:sensor domain CHASE-containing protein